MATNYLPSPAGSRPAVSPLAGHPLRLVESLLAKVREADDELARAPNMSKLERAEVRESLTAHVAALRVAVHGLEIDIQSKAYQPMGRSDRIPP